MRQPRSVPHPETPQTTEPQTNEPLPVVLGAAIVALQDFLLELIRPLTVPALRIAIGLVYVWFGVEKTLGLSPLNGAVVTMLPLWDPHGAVIGLGLLEAVLGLALVARLLVPWVAGIQALHLLGTLGVLVLRPDLAFAGGSTPSVTLLGDFVLKDLVLLAGVLVVAAHTRPRRGRAMS